MNGYFFNRNVLSALSISILLAACGGGESSVDPDGQSPDSAADVADDAAGDVANPDTAADVAEDAADDTADDAADSVETDVADVATDSDEETKPEDVKADTDVEPGCKVDADCDAPENPCKVAKCVKSNGKCIIANATNGTACDDGDFCTAKDQCVSGVCQSGLASGCEDGDVCTLDFCDAEKKCQHEVTTSAIIDASNKLFDNSDVVVNGCFLTLSGKHTFKSLQVLNGGVVNHPAYAGETDLTKFTIRLTVTEDVVVDATSAIVVDGRGYGPAQGPGTSLCGSGATAGGGHGGPGGAGEVTDVVCPGGAVNDSMMTPIQPGSGASAQCAGCAQGNPGGGVVHIETTGTVTLDGDLSANGFGSMGYAGGGAGGSVMIKAGVLAGSGNISADGGTVTGNKYGGGGGGGRVALYTDDFQFMGTVSAAGGDGNEVGGAGTIYLKIGSDPAVVTLDAKGLQALPTKLDKSVWAETATHNLLVTNGASVLFDGLMTAGDVVVSQNSALELKGTHTFKSLTVTQESLLTHPAFPGDPETADDYRISLDVTGDFTLDATSRIDVSGHGYPSDQGLGASAQGPVTGGAAHGGDGGFGTAEGHTGPGGTGYGSATQPIQLGSGSGRLCPTCAIGAAGGGAVRLYVGGTLALDGEVMADGMSSTGWHGGGAGGSVWIRAVDFAGNGSIYARGGSVGGAVYGGGGGGGRVAIYSDNDQFQGIVSVEGGNGYERGGPGTLFRGPLAEGGWMVVDAGDFACAGTSLNSDAWLNTQLFDLTITRGARVTTSGPAVLGNVKVQQASTWIVRDSKNMNSLEVTGNSIVTHPQFPGAPALPDSYRVLITTSGDVFVDAGSSILADGKGYGSGAGPGGSDTCSVSGGAGHAGAGGQGHQGTLTCPGGNPYGDANSPTALGSGSGRVCNSCPELGVPGGGAISIQVAGVFTMDGLVSANGASSVGFTGGGSGGSIWIDSGTFLGAGTFTAHGGSAANPPNYAGGGSGGRIAIYYTLEHGFTGTIAADGGTGYAPGAAGSIVFTP